MPTKAQLQEMLDDQEDECSEIVDRQAMRIKELTAQNHGLIRERTALAERCEIAEDNEKAIREELAFTVKARNHFEAKVDAYVHAIWILAPSR